MPPQDLPPSSRFRDLHKQFFPSSHSPDLAVKDGEELPAEAREAYDRNKALMDNQRFVEWLKIQEEESRLQLLNLDASKTDEMGLRMALARFQLSYQLAEGLVSSLEDFERYVDARAKAVLAPEEKH